MKKNTAGKMKIVKGEKLFMFLIVLAIITMPIVTVFSKAVLSKANIEVEKISSKIQKQEGINESLEMQKKWTCKFIKYSRYCRILWIEL